MSDHPFIYGIDFCFDVTNPGQQAPEGHYVLGYGFIKRASESSPWEKVDGDMESMIKNNKFGFQLYDLSESVTTISFVTISIRPGGDSTGPADHPSPFSDSDNSKLLDGQTLQSSGVLASCGCGTNGATCNGNCFEAGVYDIKNEGHYEMTIEARVAYNGTTMIFKCDPKMQIGSGG